MCFLIFHTPHRMASLLLYGWLHFCISFSASVLAFFVDVPVCYFCTKGPYSEWVVCLCSSSVLLELIWDFNVCFHKDCVMVG